MENVVIASFDPTMFGVHTLSDIKTHESVKWQTITRDYPRLCTAHLALKVPIVLTSSANIRKFKKAGAFPRREAVYYDPFVRNYYSPDATLNSRFQRYINTTPTDEEMVRFFQRMHNIAKKQYTRQNEHSHQPKATVMKFDEEDEEIQGSQVRWKLTRSIDEPDTPNVINPTFLEQGASGSTPKSPEQAGTKLKIKNPEQAKATASTMTTEFTNLTNELFDGDDTLRSTIDVAMNGMDPNNGLKLLKFLKKYPIENAALQTVTTNAFRKSMVYMLNQNDPSIEAERELTDAIIATGIDLGHEVDLATAITYATFMVAAPIFFYADRLVNHSETKTDEFLTGLLVRDSVLDQLSSRDIITKEFQHELRQLYLIYWNDQD